MGSIAKAQKLVENINREESDDPLASWVLPRLGTTAVAGKDGTSDIHTFLSQPALTKSGKFPKTIKSEADLADEGKAGNQAAVQQRYPAWLDEVLELLQKQKQWMTYTDWQLKQMAYQVRAANLSKPTDDAGTGQAPL